MKKGGVKFGNRGLLVLLGVLCVAIAGLSVGIWFLVNKNNDNDNESSIDESNRVVLTDRMDGWDGQISEATQALIFSDNVKDRLENDDGYDINNAISDYENAYNESSESLRFNVAIEYSYFILDFTGDLDAAINIMERVEDFISLDDYNKIYYYNTLYTLCDKANDGDRAQQYKEILDDIIRNWEISG